MTVAEAVERIDSIVRNTYTREEKVFWLSNLDAQISTFILHTTPPKYHDDEDLNTTLLAPAPFDVMYIHWLEAQIAYCNSEIERYNKENCMHKVYGTAPSSFQIQTTACRGVQSGCQHSLAIVNEVLYYKSRSGICAFDGSLPVDAGYCLGKEPYYDASAGAHGSKYYISMRNAKSEWSLFVYDASVKLWHREDSLQAVSFCSHLGEMYCVDVDTKEILCLTGGGTPYEGNVRWMAQSGEIGVSTPDTKYISRISIRLQVPAGAVIKVSAQYDGNPEWVELCSIRGTDLRSFSIPVRPVRCDHMKLRFDGIGDVKIYSIAKTIDGGSDYV